MSKRKMSYQNTPNKVIIRLNDAVTAARRVLSEGSPFRKASAFVKEEKKKRSMKSKKYGGAINSKSRGFLTAGSETYKDRNQVKYNEMNSYSHTVEYAKVQTGVDCVWVGHATWLPKFVMKLVGQSIFGQLLIRAGIWDGMVGANRTIFSLVAGDKINISYRDTPDDSAPSIEFYTVPVGGCTFGDFGDWFSDASRPWNLGDRTNRLEFQFATIGQGVRDVAVLSLIDFKLKVFTKSSMKIQNRSKAEATGADNQDSTEVVDNVPLYGKSYSGNGTVLEGRDSQDAAVTDIIGNSSFGVMVGSELAPGRSEPPQANEFRNVVSQGKIHLDPSEIKTSVLENSVNMHLNELVWNCTVPVNAISFVRKVGKFRVFALEKMIDVGAEQLISIALEVNTDIYLTPYLSKKPTLARQFVHVNG